jgi:hypothetical protein
MTSRRLTIRETAAAIGTNLGGLLKLRSKGARLYDPTFPPMVNQTFDEAGVLSWKAARDAKAANPGGHKNG